MPIKQAGMLASRVSTWPRDHFCRSTIAPRPSRPTTWNEFLPISIPITAITLLSFSDMACSFRWVPPASLLADRGQEHGWTIPLADLQFSSATTLALSAVSCSVCFAFHNGDNVRGEKVYEHSELGSEMPARRPDDSKGSGAISVVVEHGDEYAFTKLPAYGEVRQVGDTHALFGHTDQRLKRTCHGG